MNTEDRRVRRTRKLLAEALISLVLDKGYDAITIKDITDRADVAHATFYRHYRDKDELLMQKLAEIVEEITDFTREPNLQDAEGYLIFKHAQENSALYRILLGSPGALQVRQSIQQAIATDLMNTCPPIYSPQNTLIPGDIAAHHIAGSLLLLIEWWLNHDMPYPPHRMGKIYEHLVKNVTLATMLHDITKTST
jgi:AcrR family transcriptional regulator